MAQQKNDFRTVIGTVEFPPREGKAGGKDVRNIAVRQTGIHEKESVRVSATIWPSHDHIEVNEGDVVVLVGKYSENKTTNNEGRPVTYHNLSVSRLDVLGRLDTGQEPGVENEADDDTADDDLPF
jgi:hypothetical protein